MQCEIELGWCKVKRVASCVESRVESAWLQRLRLRCDEVRLCAAFKLILRHYNEGSDDNADGSDEDMAAAAAEAAQYEVDEEEEEEAVEEEEDNVYGVVATADNDEAYEAGSLFESRTLSTLSSSTSMRVCMSILEAIRA